MFVFVSARSYIPGVGEALLWGWVPFAAVLWLLAVPFFFLQSFIFRHQIVESRVRLDTVPVEKMHQF